MAASKLVSVEADFFLDLGGHSLFAATVISNLRQEREFRHLSIADLYNNPTVRGLAHHLETGALEQAGEALAHQHLVVRQHDSGRVCAHRNDYGLP